jgi:hypothetical protein
VGESWDWDNVDDYLDCHNVPTRTRVHHPM